MTSSYIVFVSILCATVLGLASIASNCEIKTTDIEQRSSVVRARAGCCDTSPCEPGKVVCEHK